MPGRLALALLAALPLVVCAAPVPPETDVGRMRRVYGAPVDPDKDCTFGMTGEKLKIGVPGTLHVLDDFPEPQNAPVVWKDVGGDFTATVRVTFPIRLREGVRADGLGMAGAGLVAGNGREFVTLFRMQQTCRQVPGGDVAEEQVVQYHITGDPADGFVSGAYITDDLGKGSESAHLRLRRQGQKLTGSVSRDGKTWKEHEAFEVKWGDTVKVGVIVENRYKERLEPVFDQYALTRPKK